MQEYLLDHSVNSSFIILCYWSLIFCCIPVYNWKITIVEAYILKVYHLTFSSRAGVSHCGKKEKEKKSPANVIFQTWMRRFKYFSRYGSLTLLCSSSCNKKGTMEVVIVKGWTIWRCTEKILAEDLKYLHDKSSQNLW